MSLDSRLKKRSPLYNTRLLRELWRDSNPPWGRRRPVVWGFVKDHVNIVVMDHYITPPAPESSSDDKNISDMDKIECVRRVSDEALGQVMGLDLEREKTAQGDAYFHRLGWKRLTVIQR
ncbi:uncharacterized protein NECHADRAFT_79760 [Fusarium vanettenii 77-13-4]|uniref:Uncharacterized protein n=1 Tax=Fusarium vanettenii (strain ATCC MYA-4622 / CBS 123669 / FGSC 9596 / NRRL 45880 / 77-13-4) TaxID=660122 RepID=C7ZMG1_FUSV7|nr:uncharacterized protein NECHADRAFT_79760 [Fusarium vanettenii 77-13-4]EEU34795.1 hypothetical protein NECHADRAFT_79760 [Fusarium vanettenii 77-13-4]